MPTNDGTECIFVGVIARKRAMREELRPQSTPATSTTALTPSRGTGLLERRFYVILGNAAARREKFEGLF